MAIPALQSTSVFQSEDFLMSFLPFKKNLPFKRNGFERRSLPKKFWASERRILHISSKMGGSVSEAPTKIFERLMNEFFINVLPVKWETKPAIPKNILVAFQIKDFLSKFSKPKEFVKPQQKWNLICFWISFNSFNYFNTHFGKYTLPFLPFKNEIGSFF